MDYNDAIENIKENLSGDKEKDIIYLINKSREYKDYDFYENINREIGKMIYNILPENEKALFSHVLAGDSSEENKKIDESFKLIIEKDYTSAITILKSIIENIDDSEENKNCDYKSLENFFELCIYTEIYKKGVPVRPTPLPFNRIYRLYAYSLYRLSRDEEAEEAFEKSIYWNPVNVPCMIELAQIKFKMKKYKSFLKIINDCLKYCYDTRDLSIIYFLLAEYFYEKESTNISAAMCALSVSFYKNNSALKLIKKIESEKGRIIEPPSKEKMNEICHKYNIQIGFNPDILKLAAGVGNDAKNQGNIEAARYCFDILFKMTADLEVKKILEKIELK